MTHCLNYSQKLLNRGNQFPYDLSHYIPVVDKVRISMMGSLKPITEVTTGYLLKMSSNPFCAVDPVPICFMKLCRDIMISPIIKIVRVIISACFPKSGNSSLTTPLLNKNVRTVLF